MRSAHGGTPERTTDRTTDRTTGAARERVFCWEWDLAATPAQLWPLVADTNRFDRDSGVPAMTDVAEIGTAGDGSELRNGRTQIRLRQFGVPLTYVQDPFEWDEPHRFSVVRRFASGPIDTLRVEVRLEERQPSGTHLTYRVVARPRLGVFGPVIDIQIGSVLARRFDRAFRAFDQAALDGAADEPSGRSPHLVRGGEARLVAHGDALRAGGTDSTLTDLILGVVRGKDDLTVARLRPYLLADRWRRPRREVLEAFLLGTRVGLFDLRWDVICPMCRGAKASKRRLADLPLDVHCETCNVDYQTDFARSVELTFSPSRSIRKVDVGEYCIGNPVQTPHVVSQHLVAARSEVELHLPGAEGRYRVRFLGHPGSLYLRAGSAGSAVDGGQGPMLTVRVTADGWPSAEPAVPLGGAVLLCNDLDEERLVLLERTSAGDHAVTGAEVTAMQRFRDLFADEVLRPSEQISVGMLAVVFTDLCDSTRLYQEIGDAVAFGRVLDHFEILTRCVDAEGGAVVKTIGDAVMAVFPSPAPGLRAMLGAQSMLRAATDGHDQPLTLKMGMHFGPCHAVTLNDRLDYFGSTVNLAARIQGCAGSGEIMLSDAAASDPEVRELLLSDEVGPSVEVEPVAVALKGFLGDRPLVRIRAR